MNPRFFRNGIVMLLLVVVALAVVLTVVNSTTPTSNTPYSEFLNNVAKDQAKSFGFCHEAALRFRFEYSHRDRVFAGPQDAVS